MDGGQPRLKFEGRGNDLVIIEDDFVVSSVKCPLVSLGRLLHRGWTMTPNPEAPAGVSLLAPDKQCEIPLQFKRNSLAVFAHIRVVHEVDEPEGRGDAVQLAPTSYPLTCIEEDENDSECDFVGKQTLQVCDPNGGQANTRVFGQNLQERLDHN